MILYALGAVAIFVGGVLVGSKNAERIRALLALVKKKKGS